MSIKISRVRIPLLSALFLVAMSRAVAQLSITDFSTATGFTLNGNASAVGSTLQLTPPLGGQDSSMFFNTPQSITGSFIASFTFTITNPNFSPNGADGIALVFQNDASGARALAGGGMNLGIGNAGAANALHPMVAVGVQTFVTDQVHLLINPTSDTFNTSSFSATGPTFGNLTLSSHVVDVSYTAGSNLLSVRLDGVTQISNYALGASFSSLLGGSTAFIGFAGSTGALASDQRVTSLNFAAVPEPSTSVLMGAGVAAVAVGLRLRRRKSVNPLA